MQVFPSRTRSFNRDLRAELLLSRIINIQLCNLFTGKGRPVKLRLPPPTPPGHGGIREHIYLYSAAGYDISGQIPV